MSSNIDYATLPIPNDKPPTKYTYGERRSELYNFIERAGHPRNLERSQEELGQRYSVSQKQISKDIDRIRMFEANRVGRDADSNTEFVLQRAVRGLLEEEEWRDAAQTQLDYYNWLFDTGEKDKAPDKLDVDQTTTHELDDEDRSLALETIRELQRSVHDDE